MSEKVLLTGGLGFIGHNLALRLRASGFAPVIFDNFSQNVQNRWHRHVVDRRIDLVRAAEISVISGDTRSVDNVRKTLTECRPDRIVHLSAIPSMVISNRDPGAAFDHNLLSTKNILEVLRLEKLPIAQLVYFSSSTVYGDFDTPTVDEGSPTRPKGIYAAAKLSSEHILNAYHAICGIPFTVVRPSALYGPRCINNRVTQVFVERALRGLPLKMEGSGEERLDFTYIDDLIEGVFLCLTRPEAIGETFNLTFGASRPIGMLVDILREHFDDLTIEHVERDPLKPLRGTLSIAKAKRLLGYEPKHDLATGYPAYIRWYLESEYRALHVDPGRDG